MSPPFAQGSWQSASSPTPVTFQACCLKLGGGEPCHFDLERSLKRGLIQDSRPAYLPGAQKVLPGAMGSHRMWNWWNAGNLTSSIARLLPSFSAASTLVSPAHSVATCPLLQSVVLHSKAGQRPALISTISWLDSSVV